MMKATSQAQNGTSDILPKGLIRPDELYTLPELKRRLNITDATLRAARRAGLQVYYKHKHGFIFGADVIAYIRRSTNKTQVDGEG